MKFIEYDPIKEKGACVLRTFLKLFPNTVEIICTKASISATLRYRIVL